MTTKTTCVAAGKRGGRLKKGYRWAKGRKACPIPAAATKPKKRAKRAKRAKKR